MTTRLDHIGLTVPDIDAATRLFESLLGARRLFDVGPFSSDDDWMARHVGVHPRAVIRTLRLLKLPGGGMLELFATRGLAQEAVHVTRLGIGEGLVGTIAENIETLNLAEATAHPDFSYRP